MWNKLWRPWAAALLVVTLLLGSGAWALPARAESAAEEIFVEDMAEILTAEERDGLEVRAEQIARQYGVGVYVLIVEDFTYYYGDESIGDFAVSADVELGWGENYDGNRVALVQSVAERDYHLLTKGEKARKAVPDAALDMLSDSFVDNFREGDFAGGYQDFFDKTEELLLMEQQGKAFSSKDIPGARLWGLVGSLLLSVALAFGVCTVLKGQLKSVAKKQSAQGFVQGDLDLRVRRDTYSHSTTRQHVDSSSSRSSGGGGYGGKSGKY